MSTITPWDKRMDRSSYDPHGPEDDMVNAMVAEIAELRAFKERVESQKPVAYRHKDTGVFVGEWTIDKNYFEPLFALPPSPVNVELVEALDGLLKNPNSNLYHNIARTALSNAQAKPAEVSPVNAEPVAWVLEWTFNGEEKGRRLYDDETHCKFDAGNDGGVCRPLVYGDAALSNALPPSPVDLVWAVTLLTGVLKTVKQCISNYGTDADRDSVDIAIKTGDAALSNAQAAKPELTQE